MTTINVKDAAGSTVAVAKVADTGSAADASSLPVASSTEDKALQGALTETAPASDTASSGLNGRLQRIAQRITSLIAATPALNSTLPTENSSFNYTMNAPQKTFRCGFEAAVASGPDTTFFTAVANGSGIAVSQSGGSLLLTSGTTAYSETILRSVLSFSASMSIRYSMNLSQRIANQEFYIEMVDVIGDTLAFTVNSATSITVTIPGTTLTSANVGQSMYIGALTLASCPGGRYAIASVSGTAITFTVASFPGSGSGTCSVFGWNFHHVLYSGVTATAANYDAGRNGYSSGDTVATINTTASPGHVATIAIRDATAGFLDELSASSTTLENALRASRVRNVPEDMTALRIQIRCINLASAPATTTTLTVGFIEVENFVAQQVALVNVSPMSLNSALPVQVANTPATTITSGTVTTVTTLTGTTTLTPGVAATNLGKAEDAVAASGDTGLFVLGVRRDVLTISASAAGDYSEMAVNSYGANIVQDYEKSARAYSCAVNVVAVASATDIATITGSATTTVFITKVIISAIQTTAGVNDVLLIKRSTADTAGTSTGGTVIPHDSADAAGTATVLAYTANPTLGTTVGTVRRNYTPVFGATSVGNPIVIYEFGDKGRPIILRGIAQVLAVNLNGATITGGTFDVGFEWFEI